MSACEACWTEASRRSFYTGRATADIYRELLRENDDDPAHTAENVGKGYDLFLDEDLTS